MAFKTIISISAITCMALVLVITTNINNNNNNKTDVVVEVDGTDGTTSLENLYLQSKPVPPAAKRVSRFLADQTEEPENPRAADHCHKDDEICYGLEGDQNSRCCGNKCIDLSSEKHHCGACYHKCNYTSECCGGECVNLAYDKRHCSSCHFKCAPHEYCIYGFCDYA